MKNQPYISYNPQLKNYSRALRTNSTLGEVLLWKQLRAEQMRGYAFNRQKPLGSYIADFYCKPLNLVIEIDGQSHDSGEAATYDATRNKTMEERGLAILRFREKDVRYDMNNVLRTIENYIDSFEEQQKNPPNPL